MLGGPVPKQLAKAVLKAAEVEDGHSAHQTEDERPALPASRRDEQATMFFGGDWLRLRRRLVRRGRLLAYVAREGGPLVAPPCRPCRQRCDAELPLIVHDASSPSWGRRRAIFGHALSRLLTLDAVRSRFPEGWGLLRSSNNRAVPGDWLRSERAPTRSRRTARNSKGGARHRRAGRVNRAAPGCSWSAWRSSRARGRAWLALETAERAWAHTVRRRSLHHGPPLSHADARSRCCVLLSVGWGTTHLWWVYRAIGWCRLPRAWALEIVEAGPQRLLLLCTNPDGASA